MNLSGVSVRELLAKYELEPADLLVMWDEVQLPSGTFKIHPDGSAGSHNGAKSVIGSIGTQQFARLRLGCGPDHPVGSLKDDELRMRAISGAQKFRVFILQSAVRTAAE